MRKYVRCPACNLTLYYTTFFEDQELGYVELVCPAPDCMKTVIVGLTVSNSLRTYHVKAEV